MTRNQQLPTVQFYTRFLVGVLVVLVAFSYQSVRAAYTEPTQNPPKYDTSQIPEIVNVGAAEQRVGNILIGAGTTGTCTGSGCYALCLNPDMTTYPGGTTDPMNCITSWDLTGLTAGLGVYLSRFNATQAAAVDGGSLTTVSDAGYIGLQAKPSTGGNSQLYTVIAEEPVGSHLVGSGVSAVRSDTAAGTSYAAEFVGTVAIGPVSPGGKICLNDARAGGSAADCITSWTNIVANADPLIVRLQNLRSTIMPSTDIGQTATSGGLLTGSLVVGSPTFATPLAYSCGDGMCQTGTESRTLCSIDCP